jgi:hypothetical protein
MGPSLPTYAVTNPKRMAQAPSGAVAAADGASKVRQAGQMPSQPSSPHSSHQVSESSRSTGALCPTPRTEPAGHADIR